MGTESNSDPSPAMFPPGKYKISGGTFNQTINQTVGQITDYAKHINDQVAHNAIMNEAGRADPVGCADGTRLGIRKEVKEWAKDGYKSDRHVFWLQGPAGAGKSSIVQSAAKDIKEDTSTKDIPIASFFFFRTDPTRSHSRPLVATLLHQLFDLEPKLKPAVIEAIKEDDTIFKRPLRYQFDVLLKKPLGIIRRDRPDPSPIILLIDGLEECNGDKEQDNLLDVLHELVTPKDSPFIALVSSRPEAHLKMTFNRIKSSSASINLDDKPASEDITLFTEAALKKIKADHPNGDLLGDNWPLEADIKAIVEKSSGQFLFAATVLRFIGDPTGSPAENLKAVFSLDLKGSKSPFAAVDAVYTHVLSRTGDDWAAARDVLAAQFLLVAYQSSFSAQFSHRSAAANLTHVLSPLGRTEHNIASCLTHLPSVVRLDKKGWTLLLYHASMSDFLFDRSRSDKFFIDLNEFACRLVPSHFKIIKDYNTMVLSFGIVDQVSKPDKSVSNGLKIFPSIQPISNNEDRKAFGQIAEVFMTKLKRLYGNSIVVVAWRDWFRKNKIPTENKWYDSFVAKLA